MSETTGRVETLRDTVERLTQAKRVIRAIPNPKLFDIHSWSGKRYPCGTSHCVGGWLRLDPWFIENTGICDVFYIEGDRVIPRPIDHDIDYTLMTREEFLEICAHCEPPLPFEDRLAGLLGINHREAGAVFGLEDNWENDYEIPKTIEATIRLLDRFIGKRQRKLESLKS